MFASKWLQIPVLCDRSEMQNLFSYLGAFHIFITGGVTAPEQGELTHEQFLDIYGNYIEKLKQGKFPEEQEFRIAFSSVFTLDAHCLEVKKLQPDKQLLRVVKPVVQLQVHRLEYTPLDGKFRSMVFGQDSLYWGVLFSYPQLYEDAKTREVFKVVDSAEFPNTKLFKQIQQWTRQHTIPTPFIVEGKRVNVPARLGKNCLAWINRHPQLAHKHLKVNDGAAKN